MGFAETPTPGPPVDAGPIAGVSQACPVEKALKGMVTEVAWGSGVSVSYAKTTVPASHWKLGDNVNDGIGSKRPGVYLVKTKGSDMLTVKVRITENKNVSGTGALSGQLGGFTMEGQCPTSVGEHTVSVKIKELPDSVQWYRGDVSWGLDIPDLGSSIALDNATRLEVFVILDNPASFYNPPGVWTEALRFLCDKVGVVGIKKADEGSAKIAQYCHSSHGLKYDTTTGAPSYGCGGSGGTFQLDNYLKKTMTVVNCYDQAGAVQSLSGALGIILDWCYLAPYGFINTTDLVGVGSCNNPFYASNGSTPVVAVDDPKRTAFGNHAFTGLAGKVLDACAGPHLGAETKAQYVTAAIDSTPTLYASSSGFRAGKESDMRTEAGVARVV